MEDTACLARPKRLLPFSEQFVCPNCGAEDIGVYCSGCGKPLQVSAEHILELFINRLGRLVTGHGVAVPTPSALSAPSLPRPQPNHRVL